MSGLLGYGRTLVVTAVEAERTAVLAGYPSYRGPIDGVDQGLSAPLVVIAAGVGPALAAAVTARHVTLAEVHGVPFDAVISAGIAGGFAGRVEVGGTVVGTAAVAADLGADSPDGFIGIDELGFGTSRRDANPDLVARLLTALPDAVAGPVVTVSTVTGTADSTAAVEKRHPDAVAEGMEGFGVALGAGGAAFAELRTISNVVGPRDRGGWRIQDALAALTAAFARLW